MQKKYTCDDIEVLTHFEHIRHAPALYIGKTIHPTHLLYEALDNSLDEANAGHAGMIGIEIDNVNNIVSIADSGRGIPIGDDTIHTIHTQLFSGGKFKKGDDNAYGAAIGLHGIGVVAITALTDWLEIEVYRDDKHAHYRYEYGECVRRDIVDHIGKKPFSTQTSFKPTAKYFESLIFDVHDIKNRMLLASAHLPKLKLLLIYDNKSEVINCNKKEYYNKTLLTSMERNNHTDIVNLSYKSKGEKVETMFCFAPTGNISPKNTGSVNLLAVNQGTHINQMNALIREVLFMFAEKEKRKVEKYDCSVGLRCFTSVMLYEPKYTSQDKEKLEVRKNVLDPLYDQLRVKLVKYFTDNEELRNEILANAELHRKKVSRKNTIYKIDGKLNNRLNVTTDSKLRNCSSNDVNKCELFILEGTSAAGSLSTSRNPAYHALLPLRGKVMNIASSSKDFYGNKEIAEIVNAIGAGIEEDFDINAVAYDKIIITTDADFDGYHIATLLCMMFLRLTPELIKHGKLYIARVPLYGAIISRKFIPIYTEEELINFKSSNPNTKITRYKGLGEMNPDQLAVCVLDEKKRLLDQVKYPEDPEALFKLMIDPVMKRRIVSKQGEL